LALLVSQSKTSAAAGAGTVGYEEVQSGGTRIMTEKAWGFEGLYIDSSGNNLPVRVFIWKGTAKLNGELEFGKEDYPGTSLQVQALEDLTKSAGQRLFKFQKVTAPAT
jgi:hypothetical protein